MAANCLGIFQLGKSENENMKTMLRNYFMVSNCKHVKPLVNNVLETQFIKHQINLYMNNALRFWLPRHVQNKIICFKNMKSDFETYFVCFFFQKQYLTNSDAVC